MAEVGRGQKAEGQANKDIILPDMGQAVMNPMEVHLAKENAPVDGRRARLLHRDFLEIGV